MDEVQEPKNLNVTMDDFAYLRMTYDDNVDRFTNEVIPKSSKSDIGKLRGELLSKGDSDVFALLRAWPNEYRILFFNKPLGDAGTFKIMLFLIGNGCPPTLVYQWVMSSQLWCKGRNYCQKIGKRQDQTKRIFRQQLYVKRDTCFSMT